MENENKLSVFGWLIILAIFAGIFYWFSLSASAEPTPINVLNILAKSLVLIVLLIIQLIAIFKDQDSLAIYPNLIALILSFETLIFNVKAFGESGPNLVQFQLMLAIIVGGISAFFALASLICYIAYLLDSESGELQALKDSLAQNPFTKLMFKQHKQEKHVEKVKI